MKQLDEILHRTNLYYQAVALGKTPPNKTDFKQAKQAIEALIEDIIGEDEEYIGEKPDLDLWADEVSSFKLRKVTNKYHHFHKDYADQDRADLKEIAKEFANTFGISYEKMKVKRHTCSFSIDDSDFYGNATLTTAVETWLIVKWADLYHDIEYYESPHLATPTNLK